MEWGGRAKRGHRCGFVRFAANAPKAAWRFASRRTPKSLFDDCSSDLPTNVSRPAGEPVYVNKVIADVVRAISRRLLINRGRVGKRFAIRAPRKTEASFGEGY